MIVAEREYFDSSVDFDVLIHCRNILHIFTGFSTQDPCCEENFYRPRSHHSHPVILQQIERLLCVFSLPTPCLVIGSTSLIYRRYSVNIIRGGLACTTFRIPLAQQHPAICSAIQLMGNLYLFATGDLGMPLCVAFNCHGPLRSGKHRVRADATFLFLWRSLH